MPSSTKASWYKTRRYLHFDRPVGYLRAQSIVTNPFLVTCHSFYPLISYEIVSSKLSKAKELNTLSKKQKTRPIAYAAHIDSHIYSYYASLLSEKYEEFLSAQGLTHSVLAFRPLGFSNIDFAYEAFQEIRRRKRCVAVAIDISGFFDNLDHKLLKNAWRTLLSVELLPTDHYAVFKSVTRYSRVDRLKLFEEFGISKNNPKNDRYRVCTAKEFRDRVRDKELVITNKAPCGIPQGTPINAILSNVYMMSFDILARQMINKLGGSYYRYCDDILLLVPASKKRSVAGEVAKLIRESKLRINASKTEVRTFQPRKNATLVCDKPLQYLGFLFDGERILIRSAALARYSQRMKKGVRLAKATMRKWNNIRLEQGAKPNALYRKSLYKKYSHFGQQNFLRYGYRAAQVMQSPAIKGQLKPLWKRLSDEIEKS